jgi:hypothetical protein
MIRANLKWSGKDSLADFLLRFGILENPNWYLEKQGELDIGGEEKVKVSKKLKKMFSKKKGK